MADFEACACPLCDAEAAGRDLEVRSELKCVTCGRYSISHDAARALDELSGAGRAVVTELLRAHLAILHSHSPVPLILESDVRERAGRLA
jgi:hypothetical protein